MRDGGKEHLMYRSLTTRGLELVASALGLDSTVLPCAAVCCSVLQRVAVCCSMLQCAVRCGGLVVASAVGLDTEVLL